MKKFRLTKGMAEAAFVQQITDGGRLLIECLDGPSRSASNLPGAWTVYVSAPDSDRWAQLELFRERQPRIFKSAFGVMGFCLSCGMSVASIPLTKGGFVEISTEGNSSYHRDGAID